ncbi:unnamed protein product [Phytophthora lilii]|uniref:Unnamed protein product n=1 Tax=Phytophthora lilii TaxID=2077276 RepID=A0A9W6WWJ2_9STRA|nr:unnamed protein product [Phytophthora lilii]
MVSLSSKNYICYLPDESYKVKVSAKGIQQGGGGKNGVLNPDGFETVVRDRITLQGTNKGFRLSKETKSIITYTQNKTALNYYCDKRRLELGLPDETQLHNYLAPINAEGDVAAFTERFRASCGYANICQWRAARIVGKSGDDITNVPGYSGPIQTPSHWAGQRQLTQLNSLSDLLPSTHIAYKPYSQLVMSPSYADTVKLVEDSYFHWEFNMRMKLSRKEPLAHIIKPEFDAVRDRSAPQWKTDDLKALGVIAGDVSLTYQVYIRGATSAAESWSLLEEQFSKATLKNRLVIARKLHNFKMESGTKFAVHVD